MSDVNAALRCEQAMSSGGAEAEALALALVSEIGLE